ncbi:hypothetical protein AB0C60_25065, partial [Streptomyces sp. NPDC048845]
MSNPADPTGEPRDGTAPRRRWRPVRLLTAAIFALAGLIFWTSFNTAQGTNLRTDDSMLELSDLIQERSRENARLDDTNAEIRDDVDRLAQRDDGSTDAGGPA